MTSETHPKGGGEEGVREIRKKDEIKIMLYMKHDMLMREE